LYDILGCQPGDLIEPAVPAPVRAGKPSALPEPAQLRPRRARVLPGPAD